jgi:hypothetical protein
MGLAACETSPSAEKAEPATTAPAAKPAPTAAAPSAASEAKIAVPTSWVQLDLVTPGDEPGEKAHGLKGESDETGDWNDKTYRHSQGGWFSWDLQVAPGQPTQLRAMYWGSDQRSFDINVDGQKLVTERINNEKPEEFFEKTYLLMPEMTKGKSKVTVQFKALNAQGYAGGVFGLRTMSPGAAK